MEILKSINMETTEVAPFIDELVDALDTQELGSLLQKENVQVDKKTFLMFVITFFITKLFCEDDQGAELSKQEIKEFLTQLLLTNPVKRRQCMELFLQFQQVLRI